MNRVDEYPGVIKNMGQIACAQTNHGTMAGSWAFFKSCNKHGIKPLLGCEFYYSATSRHIREKDDLGKPYYHLILIAKNNNGLKNLFQLSTKSFTEGMYYKPRIDDELISQYSDDVFATSACLGSRFSQLIMQGSHKAAENLIDHHAAIFKDRFFLELQTHKSPEQELVNNVLMSIASRKNLPLVLTADAHYTHKHDKEFHETTLKMATEGQGDGFTFGDIECHLHHHDEIWAKAKAQGIPYEALSNTVHIANTVDAADYFSDRKNHFPTFKSLPEGVTSWQYLEALALSGLYKRVGYPLPADYEKRFKEELAVFKKASMCDYILIVWEYIRKARELGVLVGPGRGSVGGSLICYALEITQLDPMKYGLIFERFVNPGRLGIPILF